MPSGTALGEGTAASGYGLASSRDPFRIALAWDSFRSCSSQGRLSGSRSWRSSPLTIVSGEAAVSPEDIRNGTAVDELMRSLHPWAAQDQRQGWVADILWLGTLQAFHLDESAPG